jgi:hypothetical protein
MRSYSGGWPMNREAAPVLPGTHRPGLLGLEQSLADDPSEHPRPHFRLDPGLLDRAATPGLLELHSGLGSRGNSLLGVAAFGAVTLGWTWSTRGCRCQAAGNENAHVVGEL